MAQAAQMHAAAAGGSLVLDRVRVDRRVNAIVSHPHRLVCVLVPKCGSTTLINLFAALHGIQSAGPPRDALPVTPLTPATDVGVVRLLASQLAGMRAALPGYFWFSVVRNPYDRLRANYNNKINRFARKFRPEVYALAKARHILMGPGRWNDSTATAPYIQSRITYGEFVETLAQRGIDWDNHYCLQIDNLRPDEVAYSRLVKLEQFRDGIGSVLAEAGVSRDAVSRVDLDRQLNRSSNVKAPVAPGERDKVYRLYADDFVRLGYER